MIRALADISTPLPATWLIPLIILGVIVQFLWNSVVSIVLFRIGRTDRNYEAIEDRLRKANEKIVVERDRRISLSVANHANSFNLALDLMKKHVEERDKAFAKAIESNPHQDLKMVNALNELRNEVRDSTVSTKDFDDLRKEHREMKEQLGRIATVDDMRQLLRENRQ